MYVSSQANQIVQLCVKQKLEILGVRKNTKRIHNSDYHVEFWDNHYLLVYLQMSSFSFSISIFVSRVQRFQFAMEPFELLKKMVTSKYKQLSKIGFCCSVA